MTNMIHERIINIIIADDCKLLAKLIQSYLSNFFNIRLIGIARNGNEVITMANNSSVDLVLLDIMMPEMDGIETARNLLGLQPHIKVVFLSAMNNKKIVQDAINLGAWGFLTKNSSQEEIINAINTVISGEKYFDKEILNSFLDYDQNGSKNQTSDIHSLTVREKEILAYVVEEYSASEIADKLCVSSRTVETHKRNIMSKLGVKSTVSLVKYVYENGINTAV